MAQPGYDRDHSAIADALLVGRLQIRLGDSGAARSTYQKIVVRAPDNLQALNGPGIAVALSYSVAGERDPAVWLRTRSMSPSEADTLVTFYASRVLSCRRLRSGKR